MIIDFRNEDLDPDLLDVIDLDTGRSLKGQAVFYCDDEAGIVRRRLQDERGAFIFDEATDDMKWEEVRGRFKIVLNPGHRRPAP
jgi:hypothetical protein